MRMRPDVLVDCDPGLDDAVMLLCAKAFANVRVVTTVAGNVDVERCTAPAV
ncbi:hypothetical protein GCM10028781_24550 [Nostocoides australiense]